MSVLEKYSGAGNDFVVVDGRVSDVSEYRDPAVIRALCSRRDGFVSADGTVGSDGLMILSGSDSSDFRMEFFNPDGSSGMMCGNGGRCIAAFADRLGIRPTDGKTLRFDAPDGLHTASVVSRDADLYTVCLGMRDVSEFRRVLDGWFLDTGTRHFVRFVDDVEALDVDALGRRYRHDPVFSPQGANANFVSVLPDGSLKVRTFEKGVEAETLACGTGIVASAVASELESPHPSCGSFRKTVHARRDTLTVDFVREGSACNPARFVSVRLTGPAEWIHSQVNL